MNLEDENLPRGFAAFLAQDKTATPPSDAMSFARKLPSLIPKAKPVPYPPPGPFKTPEYSEEIFNSPYVRSFLTGTGIEALKTTKKGFEVFKKDLEYMNPIPYDDLINEAVNRYISKHKR
ncbi:MAG: hypothetical protein LBC87_04105 [Fibromonadaceae bacterium]|jgi:hypothetical protein|nr:hypothetical protein [Fibromonadaceae bacterium]